VQEGVAEVSVHSGIRPGVGVGTGIGTSGTDGYLICRLGSAHGAGAVYQQE
jgi:hypothetical protein